MGRTFDQAGIQAGDLSGMAVMNMAVNGFNNISQENGDTAIVAGTGSIRYVTDQWSILNSSTFANLTVQRVASPFPSIPVIPYGLKLTAGATYTPAAADIIALQHPIEGNRIARLAWGTLLGRPLTLGVIVRPSYPLIAGLSIDNGITATRRFIRRITCPAGQDTFVPLSFDPEPTGVWALDNSKGMGVALSLVSGTGRSGGADAWLASTYPYAGSDATNLAAVAGQNVIVSGLVMFPGIVPISKETLPLIARHVPEEIVLCKRYWQNIKTSLQKASAESGRYTNHAYWSEMRIAPNVSSGAADAAANQTGFGLTAVTQSSGTFYVDFSGAGYVNGLVWGLNGRM